MAEAPDNEPFEKRPGDPAPVRPQDSEELSDDEEMKIAEMRPPLIEISINQPKVVTLSKDKKGEDSSGSTGNPCPPHPPAP